MLPKYVFSFSSIHSVIYLPDLTSFSYGPCHKKMWVCCIPYPPPPPPPQEEKLGYYFQSGPCLGALETHVLLSILWSIFYKLGDNCIQNVHLGRYNVEYTVRNLFIRWCLSGAVKLDFRQYIRRYTSPNENFEYGYPHSNALLQFRLKFEHCKPHKDACHQTKCDVINNVNFFQQHIAGYTVTNFWHPIRRRITKSSALEWPVINITLLTLKKAVHKANLFWGFVDNKSAGQPVHQ